MPSEAVIFEKSISMKKLSVLMLLSLFISAAGIAQIKKPSLSATIQTPTVHCESCKKRIEDDLKRTDGVTKYVVDFKRKTVKVTWLTDRTNIENIKTTIANAGYDADDVKANPEAYNRLPKACKVADAPKKE